MNAPHEASAVARPTVRLMLDALPPGDCDPVFLLDCNHIPADPRKTEGTILTRSGEAHARQLLSAGAPRVYLGEAALLDSAVVGKLAAEFGSERVGIHVPVKRMRVNWSMDTTSNADFRVMTPSVCEPCWEILMADGTRSGTHATWWLGEMFELGASSALIQADIADDADLNILAGLTERWADRLWLAPLHEPNPDFEAWVSLGGATRLAVSDALYQNSPYLMALRGAPSIEESGEGIG